MSLLEILEMNHQHDANVDYVKHLSELPSHIDETILLPVYYNSRTDHDPDYLHQVMAHILGPYSIVHKPKRLVAATSKALKATSSASKASSSSKSSKSLKSSKASKASSNANANAVARQSKIKDTFVKNMLDEYPFNLFNFKTRDECKSSSRSKAYYIKKTDMMNIINTTPELKKIFPTNFKKLAKDELCDIVFDGNVV